MQALAIALAGGVVVFMAVLVAGYAWGLYCTWRADRAIEAAIDAGALGNQYARARFTDEAEEWSRRDLLARALGRERML